MTEPVRLLFYLPNPAGYLDRVALLEAVARRVDRAILVVSRMDRDPESLGTEALEILEAPRGGRAPGNFLRVSSFAETLIRGESINVVHDTFGHLFTLFARKSRFPAARFVTSLYNLMHYDFTRYLLPRYGWSTFLRSRDFRYWVFRLFIQKSVCRRADTVVVQAPGLVDRLVESYPFCRDRTAWIPNNIEPSLWRASPRKGSRNPKGFLTLLSVGGFSWGKGGDRLVEFMRRCLQKGIDVRARWVGNASKMDRAWLIGECESKGMRSRIEFEPPGSRERLSRLYRDADYLFHASRLDGSPRVVLEALFHGLPVIASKHPGIEVLDPEKRFIHFWNENAGDLADAIQRERGEQSRYRERSESGARYVTDCFTSGCVSAKYVELYERLLDGRGMAS